MSEPHQPEAEEHRGFRTDPDPRAAGEREDRQKKRCEMGDGKCDKQAVGGRELCPFRRIGEGARGDLVQQRGEHGDIEEGNPCEEAAESCRQAKQTEGRQRCEGKEAHWCVAGSVFGLDIWRFVSGRRNLRHLGPLRGQGRSCPRFGRLGRGDAFGCGLRVIPFHGAHRIAHRVFD